MFNLAQRSHRHFDTISPVSTRGKKGSKIRNWKEKENIHKEGTRGHGHGPQQSGPKSLPETTQTLRGVGLLKAVAHGLELLLVTEAIALHLALYHIKRIAAQPERLTRNTTVCRDLETGDVLALDVVALGVLVHQIFERQEPHAVRLRLTQVGHRLAAEEAPHHAIMRRQFADAVQRPGVQPVCAVRLGLQTDTHVLDRAREHTVRDTGGGAGKEVLRIREARIRVFLLVKLFQAAACFVERAELHTHLGHHQLGIP